MLHDVGARPASPAPKLPKRKHPRLAGKDYSDPGFYFVTICTRNRECLFGEIPADRLVPKPLGVIANDCWLDLPNHYQGLKLGSFVVMPNHVHGLLLLATTSFKVGVPHEFPSVAAIVGGFKSAVSRKSGVAQVWQRGFYDRVVRTQEELHAISEYIVLNPSRWTDDEHNGNRHSDAHDDFAEFFRARQASPLHQSVKAR
jgi:REP element-mobilizing transposase RayT